MMTLSSIFSLIYCLAAAIYIWLGLHTLGLNPHKIINRLFFIFCAVLSIWALGCGAAASAPDHAHALLAHRFAALGWCSLFGLQLHFIILLIGKRELLNNNSWLYLLLYLPGLIALYPFVLNGALAEKVFFLVKTQAGWINMFPIEGWNLYFVTYFVSYTLASTLLLFAGSIILSAPPAKIITFIMGLAYAGELLIALLTEVILSSSTAFIVAQMAPVGILLPAALVFYTMKNYDFMGLEL